MDEYTKQPSPTHLVRDASTDELNYLNEKAWELTTMTAAQATPEGKLVRTRWEICNKGDQEEFDIRARLVACEINHYKADEFYASTLPLEAKRLIRSQMAIERVDSKGVPLENGFVDIRKAYVNATPKRALFLTFPREMCL